MSQSPPPPPTLAPADYSVRVRNLAKAYRVYPRPIDMLREVVLRKPCHADFWALQDISFDVTRGEVVGIIGLNGSGKSTLLKIITGTLDKTAGEVEVHGKVSAILELGTGFHPEYTGRENILTGGMCLGMTRHEVMAKMDSIIEFSGLREFIDRPFKTYSSGMQARLTFATATAIDPDILIVDEALATGDAAFVYKSFARIRDICRSGCTALLVSHGTGLLAQVCTKVMWLDKGRVRMIDDPLTVIRAYDLNVHLELSQARGRIEAISTNGLPLPRASSTAIGSPSLRDGTPDAERRATVEGGAALRAAGAATVCAVHERSDPRQERSDPKAAAAGRRLFAIDSPRPAEPSQGQIVFKAGPIEITRLEVLNQDDEATAAFQPMDSMTVRVHYRCEGQLPQETLGLAMAINRNADLFPVMQCSMTNPMSYEDSAAYQHAPFRLRPGRAGWVQGRIKPLQLAPGEYILSVGLLPNIANSWEFYEYHHFSYTFVVTTGVSSTGGLIYPLVSWEHCPSRNGELPKVDAGALAEIPAASAAARSGARTTHPTKAAPPGGYETLREEIQDLCFNIGGYPDAWPRHRQCPCCGSTALAPLFKKYEIEHGVCQACEFVFVNPYPPDDLVARIYNASYYPAVREFIELPRAQAGREDAALYSTPLEVLDRIIMTVGGFTSVGQWLDVGGGIGTFAHRIRNKLPSWNVVLNELNSRARQIARDVFHLDTTPLTPRELADQGRRFDVVSLMSVLEHICEPLPFVKDCVDLLAPGGHLVISVPHFTRLNRVISRDNSDNVVPPYHVSLFNDANLCVLLKRAGMAEGMQVWNDGPPAFQLIDFVHRWSYWDVRVPRDPRESPEGIVVNPMPEEVSRMIAALAEADKHVRDFSARSDGGVYLTVIATKP